MKEENNDIYSMACGGGWVQGEIDKTKLQMDKDNNLRQHIRKVMENVEKQCVFESDGEKHSCVAGCKGVVENCRKCHRDICSNVNCPLGKHNGKL